MNNQGENTQTSDAIKQIVLENKNFFLKNIKISNSKYESVFFLSYMLLVTFDNFLPTRLFSTTCLLIFAKFSLLHGYLALHVYLEHKSNALKHSDILINTQQFSIMLRNAQEFWN